MNEIAHIWKNASSLDAWEEIFLNSITLGSSLITMSPFDHYPKTGVFTSFGGVYESLHKFKPVSERKGQRALEPLLITCSTLVGEPPGHEWLAQYLGSAIDSWHMNDVLDSGRELGIPKNDMYSDISHNLRNAIRRFCHTLSKLGISFDCSNAKHTFLTRSWPLMVDTL
jgi:hypothetical protein